MTIKLASTMPGSRLRKCLDRVLTILAEANTQLAGQMLWEIVEDLETEDELRDWLASFDEARSLGRMDADQRAYFVDAVFQELTCLAIDSTWGIGERRPRELAAKWAAELSLVQLTPEESASEPDEVWETRVQHAKPSLLAHCGERDAGGLLRRDPDEYYARVHRGRQKTAVVRDGRRSTYDDRPIPGSPSGRTAREGVRLSQALHDPFARESMAYAVQVCGSNRARELTMDLVVNALANVREADARELAWTVRPAIPHALRAALVNEWQRFAASHCGDDFGFRRLREQGFDHLCDAMQRAQHLLCGGPGVASSPWKATAVPDRDIVRVTSELLTVSPNNHGDVDRRLVDEPRFFRRMWPLFDMHIHGLFAFDILGEVRPRDFPAATADVPARVQTFLADRQMSHAVSDLDLESMWDSAGQG